MTAAGPIRAVVFDLDGTLVDSREDIVRAALHALARFGRPATSSEEILGHVGDGARALASSLFHLPEASPELEGPLAAFLDFYAAHGADRTTILPGVLEALDALAPLPLAICTNKQRLATELTLARLGLAPRFPVVVAAGDLPVNKPDPAMLRLVAQKLAVDATSLVMVGDGPQDVLCGKRAGAFTVGVLSPFVPEQRLRAAGPDCFISTMAGLPAAVRELRHATSE